MKITDIHANPCNPRTITADKLDKLGKSLAEFPQMMALRPIVIDEAGMIIGGNMRYQALLKSGLKEIPDEWVKRAEDLTAEQKREFVIKDNVSGGSWNYDDLANSWDDLPLSDWGIEISDNLVFSNKSVSRETKELRPYEKVHVLLSFDPEHINQVMEVIKTITCEYEIEQTAN